MKRLILILAAIALLIIVAALTLTSLGSHPLHGTILMAHMFASGAIAVVLPVFAITWLWRIFGTAKRERWIRVGYWLILVSGFTTTAAMFLSMLPIVGTDHLEQLIAIHAYAGYAMVAAAILLVIAWICASCKNPPANN